ncbi:MAG: protein-disulfide reductase DsbD family protein [Flavobacteriales bacterium]
MRVLLSALALVHVLLAAASGPISWTFASEPAADGKVLVRLMAVCEEGWHIYALTLPRDDGPLPTVIRNTGVGTYKLDGAIAEPAAEEVDDPNFGMKVRYHAGTTTFTLPIERLTDDAFEVTGEVEFMSCNDKTCLPPRTVKFTVPVPARAK